jgi:hypothetical protein
MGFVVYSKKDGEMLRYYDNRSKAQTQVTGHNRRAIIEALKGNEYITEWDLCEWAEYEQVYARHYAAFKYYYLSKSVIR